MTDDQKICIGEATELENERIAAFEGGACLVIERGNEKLRVFGTQIAIDRLEQWIRGKVK